jgi:hypothetical protein
MMVWSPRFRDLDPSPPTGLVERLLREVRYFTELSMRAFRVLTGAVLLCGLAGCGDKPVKVSGVLKMDGTPVEGATVVFTTEDGSKSFSGSTDSAGNFELSGPQQPGALPGNYKVVVTKRKAITNEKMSPGGDDYKKQMEKMMKEGKGKTGPANPFVSGGSESKSELPAIYGAANTTPLTQKVPPDTQPVVIDIKSKP